MKSAVLSQVKVAEDDAAAKVANAESEAKKIVADARSKAEKIVADGRVKTDEAYKARIASAKDEVAEEAKKILSKGKRGATNLRKKFETGVDGVTDRVVKLVEESL